MKRTLLKNKITTFTIAAFLLGAFNVSHAQNLWTGATDGNFTTTSNWTTTPLFDGTDNLKIGVATNNPVTLNYTSALNVLQLQTSPGTELTTNTDLTSTTTNLSMYIAGKLHITGGILWGKANIYFGNNTNETPYCNIETGGTLKTKAAILIGRNSPCIVDVNGGTILSDTSGGVGIGSIAVGNYGSVGILNLNSGSIKTLKPAGGFTVGTNGTANINGGLLELRAGDLVVKGTLNVNGGLVNFLAGDSTINTAGAAGVVNLNSGTIKIAGALTAINTTINIDAGSIVLTGNQTTAMTSYITTNTIKVAGAAKTAGKTISNTFDSVTGLTTVIAVGGTGLGTSDFSLANSLSIYPNPTSDVINITADANVTDKLTVSLFNQLGKKVIEKEFSSAATTNSIDIKGQLTPGVYVAKLSVGNSNTSSKVIIK